MTWFVLIEVNHVAMMDMYMHEMRARQGILGSTGMGMDVEVW